MGKLAKLYDFALGLLLGSSMTLLVVGYGNAALVVALVATVFRFTAGRHPSVEDPHHGR